MRTEWINNQTNEQNCSVIPANDSIQVSFTNGQKRDKIIRHKKSKKKINQRNSHGNTSSSYEIMQRCVHRVASIFVYSIQYRCVLSRLSSHTWTYTLTVFLFTITSNAFGEQTLLLYANYRCHHVLYYGGIASFFILFY